MLRYILLSLLLLGNSCKTVGPIGETCGPNDVATRLSPAVIDQLTDAQVKDLLSKNEALVKRGCATPNKE